MATAARCLHLARGTRRIRPRPGPSVYEKDRLFGRSSDAAAAGQYVDAVHHECDPTSPHVRLSPPPVKSDRTSGQNTTGWDRVDYYRGWLSSATRPKPAAAITSTAVAPLRARDRRAVGRRGHTGVCPRSGPTAVHAGSTRGFTVCGPGIPACRSRAGWEASAVRNRQCSQPPPDQSPCCAGTTISSRQTRRSSPDRVTAPPG